MTVVETCLEIKSSSVSPSRSRKLQWLGNQDARVANSRYIQPGQPRSDANAHLKSRDASVFDDKKEHSGKTRKGRSNC